MKKILLTLTLLLFGCTTSQKIGNYCFIQTKTNNIVIVDAEVIDKGSKTFIKGIKKDYIRERQSTEILIPYESIKTIEIFKDETELLSFLKNPEKKLKTYKKYIPEDGLILID